jgi:hypothetical protein
VKTDWEQADRAAAVRSAGASWHRVGLIDAAGLTALNARFPDDRSRVGPVFGVLLFIFTYIGIASALGFCVAMFEAGKATSQVLSILGFITGLFAAVATEWQIGGLRRRDGGTESATSLVAVSLVLWAVADWLDPLARGSRLSLVAICLCCLLVTGLAAWRWGYPAYAGIAAIAAFAGLAQCPWPRWSWVVAPLLIAPLFLRASRSGTLPPAHRHSALVAGLVSFAALYAAIHCGSYDWRAIETLGGHSASGPSHEGLGWKASVAATALLPLVVIAWSIARRRVPMLCAGVVAAGVSIGTYRFYVDTGPLWIFLAVVGAAVFGLAFAVWKFLDRGPNGERLGFSAAPLLTDLRRHGWIESAAAAAIPVSAHSQSGDAGFEGGGGRSGGGGASAGF